MAQNDNLGPGMSDFGLSASSQSNSVGQDNPALVEFLKASKAIESPAARAAALGAQRRQLQSTPDVSPKDKLASLLIPALLAGGAGLAGQGHLAAGIGLGGLEAPVLLAKEENAAKREHLEKTIEQEEKQLDRVDKIHQRINQLVIANPDAFMDKDGELLVSRDMLGFLASGMQGLPMDVRTKRIMDARYSDRGWKARLDMALDGLGNAQTHDEAKRWAMQVQHMLGLPVGNEVLTSDMISALNTPEGAKKALDTLTAKADPKSVRRAVAWLNESGLNSPMQNPSGFLEHLTFDYATNGRTPLKEKYVVDAVKGVRDFMADPNNSDALTDVYDEHGFGTDEASRAIVEMALFDKPVLRDAYMSYMSRWEKDGITEYETLKMANEAVENADPLTMLWNENMKEMGYDPEEAISYELNNLDRSRDLARKTVDRTSASSYASLQQRGRQKLRKVGLRITPDNMFTMYQDATNIARRDRGLDEADPIPFAAIEEVFMRILDSVINQYNSADQ